MNSRDRKSNPSGAHAKDFANAKARTKVLKKFSLQQPVKIAPEFNYLANLATPSVMFFFDKEMLLSWGCMAENSFLLLTQQPQVRPSAFPKIDLNADEFV